MAPEATATGLLRRFGEAFHHNGEGSAPATFGAQTPAIFDAH